MFRYYYGFDIYYLVLILPAMLLGLWAQARVNSTFNRYSHVRCRQGTPVPRSPAGFWTPTA